MIGTKLKKAVGVFASGLLLVGLSVAFGGPAEAAGGEHGVMRIHGAGSVFAGSGAEISVVTSQGGTASYTFEVLNTGADTAQYNLRVADYGCGGTCGATTAVTAGNLIVTKLTAGPNGYFTAPIDAGKLATYTFKVTVPKAGLPNSFYQVGLLLYDTSGLLLDGEDTITQIKATTGTRADDEFINGASQLPVSAIGYGIAQVSSPVVAVGGKTTFTVKLANDSAAPAAITWQILERQGCAEYFALNVKAGSLDVTSLVLSGSYVTPVLAPKASKTLSLTITYLANAHSCLVGSFDYWWAITGGEILNLAVPVTP
jgi:hypothetical protein